MTRIAKSALRLVGAITLVPLIAWAADIVDLPDGSKLDLSQPCPVCNMPLKGSELGPAVIVFKDGKVVGLDGAGHMFRYLLDPNRYGFDSATIKEVYVTDYETKKLIDAKKVFFVTGSDTRGHEGKELVPFSTKEAVEKFKEDHQGKSVVAYAEVKPEDVKSQKKMLRIEHEGAGGGHGH